MRDEAGHVAPSCECCAREGTFALDGSGDAPVGLRLGLVAFWYGERLRSGHDSSPGMIMNATARVSEQLGNSTQTE